MRAKTKKQVKRDMEVYWKTGTKPIQKPIRHTKPKKVHDKNLS